MSAAYVVTVGYARVSGKKQVKEGDGLGSQEARIKDYVRLRGYPPISAMFTDDRSGGTDVRPGFAALIKFLVKNRNASCIVVIDDITRLARAVTVHHKLRHAITKTGAKLESPSFEFGESSDDQLVENLLASVSQHQRQKNGEQVRNRMKGRLLGGYWPFATKPVAYQFQEVNGQNILVRREPIATIVAEALEGFAIRRFQIQAEVQRFLEQSVGFPRQKDGTVKFDRVTEMLKCVLYAGMIEYPKWDVSLRPAQHEGLISYETHLRIQKRLNETAKTPARANLAEGYPLRQSVQCAHCGRPLGGGDSQGRNDLYHYYFCLGKTCHRYRKSIDRDEMHAQFEQLLKTLTPAEQTIALATDLFREAWDIRATQVAKRATDLQREAAAVQKSIGLLIDRISFASNLQLVSAYEGKLVELESQKALLLEKVLNTKAQQPDFDTTLRTALDFLASPWKLWETGRLEDRRAVLKLVFAQELQYAPETGFRTAETTLPFKVLDDVKSAKSKVVPLAGIEPARL